MSRSTRTRARAPTDFEAGARASRTRAKPLHPRGASVAWPDPRPQDSENELIKRLALGRGPAMVFLLAAFRPRGTCRGAGRHHRSNSGRRNHRHRFDPGRRDRTADRHARHHCRRSRSPDRARAGPCRHSLDHPAPGDRHYPADRHHRCPSRRHPRRPVADGVGQDAGRGPCADRAGRMHRDRRLSRSPRRAARRPARGGRSDHEPRRLGPLSGRMVRGR